MGDVIDDVFGIAPPSDPPPPPPPPPLPEVLDEAPSEILEEEDQEQVVRDRLRREAARRGRSSLMREDPGTSAIGGSGVSIL